MKFTADRPYSDPEKAARKIVEIANSVEPGQEGRIYIELINAIPIPREGYARRIQGWLGSRNRERLAGDARERDLRKIHGRRCGSTPSRGCRHAGADYLATMLRSPFEPCLPTPGNDGS